MIKQQLVSISLTVLTILFFTTTGFAQEEEKTQELESAAASELAK